MAKKQTNLQVMKMAEKARNALRPSVSSATQTTAPIARPVAVAAAPIPTIGGIGPMVGKTQPATPGGSVAWQDAAYNDAVSGIKTGLDNFKTNAINTGIGLGVQYGIDFKGDPITGAKDFAIAPDVDITNPFSRAALLKRSYDQAQRGNTNSYAARGQLYSGALQNAKNETDRGLLEGQNALLSDFQSRFGELYGQWLAAEDKGRTDKLTATTDAQGRHINDPAFNPGGTGKPTSAVPAPVALPRTATAKYSPKKRKRR